MSATNVRAVPEGFHTVTPYITASDAKAVIDFLQRAFDAKVTERIDDESGGIRHAQVQVGDSFVMLTDGNDACSWSVHCCMPCRCSCSNTTIG